MIADGSSLKTEKRNDQSVLFGFVCKFKLWIHHIGLDRLGLVYNRLVNISWTDSGEVEVSSRHFSQISDELRRPLQDLSSLAHISEQCWQRESTNSEAVLFANRLAFTSEYVLSSIRDFADCRNIEQSKLVEQFLDPNELVMGAISTARPLAVDLNVKLEKSGINKMVLLFGDLKCLRQMLVRGLLAAIENVGTGGCVCLSTRIEDGRLMFSCDLEYGKDQFSSQECLKKQDEFRCHWSMSLIAKLVEKHGGILALKPNALNGRCGWVAQLPKHRVQRIKHRTIDAEKKV